MNDTPRVNWQGRVGLITNYGCGRIGEDNRARAFWQSRAGLREPPQLVSIEELARKVREEKKRDRH